MQRMRTAVQPAAKVDTLLGKSLPFSVDAERAVLGALLLNDERARIALELLSVQDFYMPAHGHVFTAMQALVARQQRIDTISVHDELSKMGIIESIGGMVYLLSLQEDIPAAGLVEQHARIIREKAILRELITSAMNIITQCYSQNTDDIDAVLDDAEKTIFRISQQRTSQTFVQLTIWLKKAFQKINDVKGSSRGITGIPSGLKALDEMTSGFQSGDLIVLAARPSMGKTALALSIAAYAAQRGNTVGFFSLEMGAEQLALRLLSSQSRVPHHAIRTGAIGSEEWVELTHAAGRLSEMRFFIDDTAMQSIHDIRSRARKLIAEQKLSVLVVDYLQLIHTVRRHENRHQEVSEISRSLKALAKELSIPVIALSQLSRAVDSRIDKRPMLSDLRDSGAIEQDADLILFLYRDIVYNPETENPALSELIIGKQRNGPTGTVYLTYQRDIMQFVGDD